MPNYPSGLQETSIAEADERQQNENGFVITNPSNSLVLQASRGIPKLIEGAAGPRSSRRDVVDEHEERAENGHRNAEKLGHGPVVGNCGYD